MERQGNDLILNDREIINIGRDRFGVVIKEEEAIALRSNNYKVRTLQPREDEETKHYLVVWIGAYQRDNVDQAMIETVGRADVIVHPETWKVGQRSGVKSYVKSAIPKAVLYEEGRYDHQCHRQEAGHVPQGNCRGDERR